MCRHHSHNNISGGSICNQMNNHIPTLINGRPLTVTEQIRAKVHDDIVGKIIPFVILRDRVVATSWGERTFL